MPIGFYDAPGVFDDARWATNWEVQSNAVQVKPFSTCNGTVPESGINQPNMFSCGQKAAYQSFRNPYPGESGQRNLFRVPGYFTLDFGLGKTFHMSGLSSKIPEGHQLQFRWEVFNATNTQSFGAFDGSRTGFGIGLFPGRKFSFGNLRKLSQDPRFAARDAVRSALLVLNS